MSLPRERVLHVQPSQWAELESTLVSTGLNAADIDLLYVFNQPFEPYTGVKHNPTGYTLILNNVDVGSFTRARPGLYVTAEPGPDGPAKSIGPLTWAQVVVAAREWGGRVVRETRAMAGHPYHPQPEPPPAPMPRVRKEPLPLVSTSEPLDARVFKDLAPAPAEEKRDMIDHLAGPFRRHRLLAPVIGLVLLVGIVGDFAGGLGVLKAMWTFLNSLVRSL